MKFADKLNEVFFPSGIKCLICGDDIPEGSRFPVCENCAPKRNLTFCLTCGRNMSVGSQYCTNCKSKEWSFRKARAPFVYDGEIRHLIHRLKYGGHKYLAQEIAVYLADAYFEYGLMSDIITFVPMFHKKMKRRGYNQAEELAVALGEKTNTEVRTLLIKTIQTKSNARLNAAERSKSIKDTIDIVRDEKGHSVDLKDKRILLIDDVFTTGATAQECAKALMKAHAAEVNVLTLATAKHSDNPVSKRKTSLKDINP